MGSSIFKIFQIFGIVSNWAGQALADQKITLKEATSLAEQIAEVLGVEIEIEVPIAAETLVEGLVAVTGDDTAKVEEEPVRRGPPGN